MYIVVIKKSIKFHALKYFETVKDVNHTICSGLSYLSLITIRSLGNELYLLEKNSGLYVMFGYGR